MSGRWIAGLLDALIRRPRPGDGRAVVIHRVGTPAEWHTMKAREMRDYLNTVLAAHSATVEMPEPVIDFPGGFWISLTTEPDEQAPRP